MVYSAAWARGSRPAARSVSVVTGPMEYRSAPSSSDGPPRQASRFVTVDELVNVTASTSPARRAAASASAPSATARVRYAATSLTCAPGTAERVDAIVAKLIEDAHDRALQILKENKFKLHELARYLYKKETITGEEFMNLLTRENPLMPKQQ